MYAIDERLWSHRIYFSHAKLPHHQYEERPNQALQRILLQLQIGRPSNLHTRVLVCLGVESRIATAWFHWKQGMQEQDCI